MLNYLVFNVVCLRLTACICIYLDEIKTVMLPTKKMNFELDSSSVFENKCFSGDACNSNVESETAFNNSRKF